MEKIQDTHFLGSGSLGIHVLRFFPRSFSECGGTVKIIASIEDPAVIKKILDHLDQNIPTHQALHLPESKAPPPIGLMV